MDSSMRPGRGQQDTPRCDITLVLAIPRSSLDHPRALSLIVYLPAAYANVLNYKPEILLCARSATDSARACQGQCEAKALLDYFGTITPITQDHGPRFRWTPTSPRVYGKPGRNTPPILAELTRSDAHWLQQGRRRSLSTSADPFYVAWKENRDVPEAGAEWLRWCIHFQERSYDFSRPKQ